MTSVTEKKINLFDDINHLRGPIYRKKGIRRKTDEEVKLSVMELNEYKVKVIMFKRNKHGISL